MYDGRIFSDNLSFRKTKKNKGKVCSFKPEFDPMVPLRLVCSGNGANLTPYSGVIFRGVTLTPKRSLKNSFSGVKVTTDFEELK